MIENNIYKFDTSDILTEEEFKTLNELHKITRTIFYYIDRNLLLERIRAIVDECPFINFKNDRSRKFMDKNHPVMNLIVDKNFLYSENLLPTSFANEEAENSFYSNLVFDNIIRRINDFINDCIHNNANIQEFLNGRELFTDLEDKNLLTNTHIFSSIFAIRMDPKDKNIVTVEMMI